MLIKNFVYTFRHRRCGVRQSGRSQPASGPQKALGRTPDTLHPSDTRHPHYQAIRNNDAPKEVSVIYT